MNNELLVFGAITVVGLAEWFKSFDKEDKLKKYYNLLPLILSIPVAIILTLSQDDPWYLGFLYWGVTVGFSVLGYTTVIETIQKMLKK